ncbi:MAG TPA: MlaD family protein [Acidimicrobiales bacterium]|nr:MlaD family protein [Acidimicrobiales bacterium]
MRMPRLHLPKNAGRMGIYAAACLVLLVGLAVRIGSLSLFTHRTSYQALMSDVTGLTPGSDVKIAGVTVGQVSAVGTDRGHALVTFAVKDSVHVPADSRTQLRWRNVIGQKYLYLVPGPAGGPDLRPGGRLPLSQEISSADIGKFLNDLGPVISAIDPQEANAFVQGVVTALSGNEVQIDSLINSAASVSQTVGGLNTQVGQVIDNLDTVMTALAGRQGDLQTVVSNLATISSALAQRNDTLDSVVGNFAQLSGEFANLLSTNRSNLDQTIANLQTVTQDIAAHKSDLNADLATLTQGTAPYVFISSYGQWFNVQQVYTCMADEQNCSYGNNQPVPFPGGGSGGTPPATPSEGPVAPASSGIPGLLQQLAGKS